jgi:hypothetical protein
MNLKPLEEQIVIARACLASAIEDEVRSGYDFDETMERKWNEGWAEALDFIYILLNGSEYPNED